MSEKTPNACSLTGHEKLKILHWPVRHALSSINHELVVRQDISSLGIDTVALAALQVTTSELNRTICKEASWKAPRM